MSGFCPEKSLQLIRKVRVYAAMSLVTLPTAPTRALRAGQPHGGPTAVLESPAYVGTIAGAGSDPKPRKALRFGLIVVFWLGLGAVVGLLMR